MNRVSEQPLVEPPRHAALVPPRPNPGPEPWRDEFPGWIVLIPVVIGVGLILAWRWRRRRAASDLSGPSIPLDDSPETRLLTLCERLRALLSSWLGPGLHARTTEEIVSDPRVVELLGDDRERLAAILGAGDRLKFARREEVEGLEEQLVEWTSWADAIEAMSRRR